MDEAEFERLVETDAFDEELSGSDSDGDEAEEGGGGAPIKMRSLVGNTTISSTYGLSESPLQNKTHERGRQKGWDGSSVQLPIVATTPWERIHERQRSNNPLSARATSARSAR